MLSMDLSRKRPGPIRLPHRLAGRLVLLVAGVGIPMLLLGFWAGHGNLAAHVIGLGALLFTLGLLMAVQTSRGIMRAFRRASTASAGAMPEDLLSAVVEALPVGVVILDAQGAVVRNNAAHRVLWGLGGGKKLASPSEWIGWRPDDEHRLAPDEWPILRALREGRTVAGELLECQRFGSGERRRCLVSAAPVRDSEGRLCAVVGVAMDVTERHRMQEQLRQGQKLQALGELAGGIAHDFNNVLNAVRLSAEVIARMPQPSPTTRERAGQIIDTVGRGSAVTRRLLAFARRSALQAAPVDVADLLANVREILAASLGARICVQLDAPPGLPPLWADKDELETVLINLATNARDAMPDGGALVLSARRDCFGPGRPPWAGSLAPGCYLRVAVRDTGRGMDEATLARVAEPFFTTKPAGQGTGLGLSMAKGFAEQSGGALVIDSAPGQGTTVTLWMPEAAIAAAA